MLHRTFHLICIQIIDQLLKLVIWMLSTAMPKMEVCFCVSSKGVSLSLSHLSFPPLFSLVIPVSFISQALIFLMQNTSINSSKQYSPCCLYLQGLFVIHTVLPSAFCMFLRTSAAYQSLFVEFFSLRLCKELLKCI